MISLFCQNFFMHNLRKLIREYISVLTMGRFESNSVQFDLSETEQALERLGFNEPVEEIFDPLQEGLIRSVPWVTAFQILTRHFDEHKDQFVSNKERGTMEVQILNFSDEEIKNLISKVGLIGYFFSQILVYSRQENSTHNYADKVYSEDELWKILGEREKYNGIILCIQGKFVEEVKNPYMLFHVTRKDLLDKIMRVGLIPKSKSKKAHHPERIYFARTVPLAEVLMEELQKYTGGEYVILRIEARSLKNVKFYNDPDFWKAGVFTLDNVPKEVISVLA